MIYGIVATTNISFQYWIGSKDILLSIKKDNDKDIY